MGMTSTRILLVTANVGSIFEDSHLSDKWIREFQSTVNNSNPHFIGLHCQEIGGKRSQNSCQTIQLFVRSLSEALQGFSRSHILIDCDWANSATFTALGSLYFARNSLDLHIWDFGDQLWIPVVDHVIHMGNIEEIKTKQKHKFPQIDGKRARKGFMRTRWLLKGIEIDLMNVHLFHDPNNLESISRSPSQYAIQRREALNYALQAIGNEDTTPLFVFGDFNFRLDSRALIERFTERTPIAINNSLLFEDNRGRPLVTIAKKRFEFEDKELFSRRWKSLLDLDKEVTHFPLQESNISFPPSYPFCEDRSSGEEYMWTRCPSWCDRVLMNSMARSLLKNERYLMLGSRHPMGDHKPVSLHFQLRVSRLMCVQTDDKLTTVCLQTNL